MRYVGRDFPPMDPVEQIDLGLDFVNEAAKCDSIASATWTIAVVTGTDSQSSTRALGSISYCNQVVTQRMGGLLNGVKYRVTALATMASGEVLSLYSHVMGKS